MEREDQDLVRRLARQLEETRTIMLEISQRLDVSNVGHCKWQLMRCADIAAGALRAVRPVEAADQPTR